MKLIKINTDHYIIVDDSEIKINDWVYSMDGVHQYFGLILNTEPLPKKITHSTQPLEWFGGEIIFLSEVKELLGEVYVEKKAEKFIGCEYEDIEDNIDQIGYDSFIRGYNQALEDNKDKKYTEEDLRKAYIDGHSLCRCVTDNYDEALESVEKYIQSLQPKTEWEVEFIDGKLKLK